MKSILFRIVSRTVPLDQNPILAQVARTVDILVMRLKIVGGWGSQSATNMDSLDISKRTVKEEVKTTRGKGERSLRKVGRRKIQL